MGGDARVAEGRECKDKIGVLRLGRYWRGCERRVVEGKE